MTEIPRWFSRAIADGVSTLLTLKLPGEPYTDAQAKAMRVAWTETLWRQRVQWIEDLDRARLGEGFIQLAGVSTRWPTPALLMQHLPSRPVQQALPPPQPTEEQRRQLREGVRALRDVLGMREPKAPNDADENAMKQRARGLGGKR